MGQVMGTVTASGLGPALALKSPLAIEGHGIKGWGTGPGHEYALLLSIYRETKSDGVYLSITELASLGSRFEAVVRHLGVAHLGQAAGRVSPRMA
ncbi:hypothetical protein GCM10025772_03950 [Ferrimonas gelatinilytica]|uniref:Uncharacterized protein n=1 Tax=Ferrimonas gelatinilytica TaxID=1255257 RepID=A0ABP9RTT6_9GAMM